MATNLKNTTTMVKRGIIYFILFIIVILIVDRIFNPPPPPPPPGDDERSNYPVANELFGQIQRPQLSSIDAVEGSSARFSKKVTEFPEFPPTIYVYPIEEQRETFSSSEKGKYPASKLGFTDYTQMGNVMTWQSDDGNKVFIYDRVQDSYIYRYKKAELPILTTLDADKSIQKGASLVQYLGIEVENIDIGSSYAYFASRSGDDKLTTKTESYNSVLLALNKKILGIKPLKNDMEQTYLIVRKYKYYQGIATLLIREFATKTQDQILDLLELKYEGMSYKATPGVYELLKVDDAYKQVQINKGFLYRLHQEGENYLGDQNRYEVIEFKVDPALTKLIYIEPEDRDQQVPWTIYLQPFYLFEGTAYTYSADIELEFSILVPALTNSSYRDL